MKIADLPRHIGFWIGLAAVAVAALAFSFHSFSSAFPIVSLDLEMDREGALAAAERIAREEGWAPEEFRQAASFGDDRPEVRTFLELELDEGDAVERLVRDGGYHPFHWRVRHFAEGEVSEVRVRFTPGGEPYGFRLQLPEDEPGATLSDDEARGIAEATATERWGVELDRYELVEASQELRPGGRLDHTFTYRRTGVELGEGEYRLRLGVAGDRASEVTRFIQVPEGFSRRYQEMRSANTRLALVASAVFILLFFLGGCVVGSVLLLRAGWLTWRMPVVVGGVVAALMALNIPNSLPSAWMGYDTAISPGLFLAGQVGLTVGGFLFGWLFLALVFMGAESLGRRAFPRHVQFWKVWAPGVANSRPLLGRTLAGYFIAIIEVAFVVAFYRVVSAREGWWVPSDALIQPDLLASYLPWLTAVSLALFSGLWEESVFRAVPIAAAALIGRRFGRPGLWIAAALVLQAVVFAAGHADYPQQPSYARLLELTGPALMWGLLYLWLGLLPVVIAHAGYNLAWMSLPLFVSSAPGIWVDRTVVILVALLPLAVVLFRSYRGGLKPGLPEGAYNRGWRPEGLESGMPPSTEHDPELPVPTGAVPRTQVGEDHRHPASLSRRLRMLLVAAGGLGLLLWLAVGPFTPHTPPLDLDRAEAEARAGALLEDRGIELPEGWRTLSWVDGAVRDQHRFVWERGGEEAFAELLGSYLQPGHWHVRFAGFEGPVEERAEEVEFEVGPGERTDRFRHQLPEDRSGATLTEEEARVLAHDEVRGALGLEPELLLEISAEERSRPARTDWTFTFSDTLAYSLDQGEARVRVVVAGDRVTERTLLVHVPEEWERERASRTQRNLILTLLSGGVFVAILLLAAVLGAIRLARGSFHRLAALWIGGGAVLISAISWGNGLPQATSQFFTAQPFGDQVLAGVLGLGIGGLILAGVLGLVGGYVHGWWPGGARKEGGFGSRKAAGLAGIGSGLLAAGMGAVGAALAPLGRPVWPDFDAAGAWSPLAGAAIAPLLSLLGGGLVLLLIFGAARRREERGGSRAGVLGGLFMLGFLVPRDAPGLELWPWLLVGVGIGVGFLALHALVRRVGPACLPPLMATLLALDRLREVSFSAYGGAVAGGLLSVILLGVVAAVWMRALPGPTSTRPGLPEPAFAGGGEAVGEEDREQGPDRP